MFGFVIGFVRNYLRGRDIGKVNVRNNVRGNGRFVVMVKNEELLFGVGVLFFLPSLKRVRVNIRGVVDDMCVSEQRNPAYVCRKQDNQKPLHISSPRDLHMATKIQ